MKEEQNKPVNLADYTFEQDTLVEIPGELMIALLDSLVAIEQQDTRPTFMHTYSDVEDGKLVQKPFDSKSFFAQEPVFAVGAIGATAADMRFNLMHWMLESVKQGKAVLKAELRRDEPVN